MGSKKTPSFISKGGPPKHSIGATESNRQYCGSIFYKLSNKAIKRLYFEKFDKTPNFGAHPKNYKC